jgi:putative ABC transport system permease protein
MLRFIPLILKNSFRNRRRSILTVLSMGASLCLLGILFSLYQALFLGQPSPTQALRLITRHRVSLTNFLPASYEAKIRALPGVKDLTSWSWFGGVYKDNRDPNNFFARFAVEPDHYFGVRPDIKIDDSVRQAFLKERTGAIATNKLATKLGWKVGDRITLIGDIFPVTLEFKLVGLFDDSEGGDVFLFNREYLTEALPAGSKFRDAAGTYYILGDSVDSMPKIARAIDDMFDNAPQPTKTESEKQFQLSFVSFLGNLKLFLAAICAAVTFTILLVSGNTMAMSVRERVREVGILKTLGFTSGEVLGIILGEASIISLIGGFFGLVFATVLVGIVRKADIQFANINAMTVSPQIWVLCLAVALLIGLVSAFVPAQGASRTSILDALRSSG